MRDTLSPNPVGRPKGWTRSKSDMLNIYHYAIALLMEGHSIRTVAETTDHSPTTIHKLKRLFIDYE